MFELLPGSQELITYYQEESIPYTLDLDKEFGIAVISTKNFADEPAFKNLGKQLQAWKSSLDTIKSILGLEQLLKGKHPQIANWLVGISYIPNNPFFSTSYAILVTIDSSAKNDWKTRKKIAQSLSLLLENNPITTVMSIEEYSFWNR